MIDSMDEQLVRLIQQNANQTSEELGKKLSVSASTVRRRTQRLVKEGIVRFVARPEPDKIGFPLIAMIAFDVDHERLHYLIQRLSDRPEIKWLAATSGRFDILAVGWFASTNTLFTFIENDVAKLQGIRNTETFICLQVAKHL